jgi:hypothetical protein
MKRLLAVFVVAVYLVPLAVFRSFSLFADNYDGVSSLRLFVLPIALIALVLLLIVLNIIFAAIGVSQKRSLPFSTLLIFKLALIPFYVVNFAAWFIGSIVFHTALVVIPMLPFIIVYTYFTILATSAYSIGKLILLRPKGFVKHCILQFVFVFDVIDCIILAIKYSEKKISAIATTEQRAIDEQPSPRKKAQSIGLKYSEKKIAAIATTEQRTIDEQPSLRKKAQSIGLLILLSVAPGLLVAVALFANAVMHDVSWQIRRGALPSTDLSQICIEGYALGDYPTDYNRKINYATIWTENGERYYRRVDDTTTYVGTNNDGTQYEHTKDYEIPPYVGGSPIARIRLAYPLEYGYSGSPDDTWQLFTVNGVPSQSFEDVMQTLGESYIDYYGFRSHRVYNERYAYIDHEHNLELRLDYNDYYGAIVLIREDKRNTFEWLSRVDTLYDDLTYYGNSETQASMKMFSSSELVWIIREIGRAFAHYEVLFPSDYVSLVIFSAVWLLPLFLYVRAIRLKKRWIRFRWIVPIIVWYFAVEVWGVMMYLASQ